jgi:hypothetical protein
VRYRKIWAADRQNIRGNSIHSEPKPSTMLSFRVRPVPADIPLR